MSKSKGKKYEKRRGISLESIKQVTPFLMIFFLVLVISGGIYDVTLNPKSSALDQNGASTFIKPGTSDQTSSEGILTFISYGIIMAGGLLINRSSRTLYDKQSANTKLILGVLFSAIGFAILLIMYNIKTG
jgi:hypothetical protein